MQNAKVRKPVNYLSIWPGVWVLLKLRNLECFILITELCGMLRRPGLRRRTWESAAEGSLPTQPNCLRQGNFVGKVCWQSVGLSLLLCALLRERAVGSESRHETFAALV